MSEVLKTDVVPCAGRKIMLDKESNIFIWESALDKPVHALITTFRDGTREVCCPLAILKEDKTDSTLKCSGTGSVSLGEQKHFSPCAFMRVQDLFKEKEQDE